MQIGEVDVCITGTDRTALNGDVCNKIGTYLKALAAYDNNIPFFVAAPISSIDFNTAIDLITTGQVTTKEKIDNRMPEITLNWRDHYLSWKKFSEVPSLFLKYEDLLHDIEFEIKKITDFFYNNYNIKVENQSNKIKNIIESTKFYNLKKIESESSFIESPGSSFFREGKRNQWINILNKEQIDLLEQKFRNQLIELNYIIND